MCIHHNQSSQPEDGFSPLGHKVGTILHACNIILLLLMFSLLMLKMIMIAINVGLWKQFCSRLFDLLLQMLILSSEFLGLMLFEHFLSLSYFSGTSLFSISSKEVSPLSIPANFASLLRFEPFKIVSLIMVLIVMMVINLLMVMMLTT